MNLIDKMHDTRTGNETQLFHGLHICSIFAAIYRRFALPRLIGRVCGVLLIGGLLFLAYSLLPANSLPTNSLSAMPARQDSGVLLTLPTITPSAATAATLHTHIATIAFDADAQGAPVLRFTATYDVRNETREPIELPLRITGADVANLALTVGGAPLPILIDDGGAFAQVTTPANGSTQIALAFSQPLSGVNLMQISYPTELLRQWRGQRSIRIELAPGAGLGSDAWLRVEPDSWSYAPFTDNIQLEWMFEGSIPSRILFETITPAAWQELQRLLDATSSGASAPSAALGERYRRLALAAGEIGHRAAEERFWGQAVAAYTEGIRRAETAGVSAVDAASLHAGLAALYRERISGTESALYAQAMAAEAAQALRGIMVDDPRRAELEQWQIDGLRLMLADLRRRGDIPGALALIEQLRSLPGAEGSGAAFLEQERQALIVQQAVQLVEQGDRSTALALAGELIDSPTLQPPPEYRNLFTRWNVFATMSVDGVEVRAEVHVSDERADEAQAALDEIVRSWRTAPPLRATNPQAHRISANGEPVRLELALHIPTGGNGVELARMLPATADWAMLRQLLNQLGPQIRTQTNGLWQRVEVSQPLDLRTVGEEWRRIAVELDRQAEALEEQATKTSAAATMQASQEARLRAANYRYTAQSWRDLTQNSQVMASLSTPSTANNTARTWMVTVTSPPQMLNLQVDAISAARAWIAALIALSAVSGLAVVLWRLL